ncbi:hypothetical protein [Streptomyces maremycinicus]|uniref:hypothetical protein n=1 Tax=Streptomyces maremycinicus TaxID=1679753 RepID=UPI000787FC86|nr:hypothetical protein [Streptomyces sp. NBRC 110468]
MTLRRSALSSSLAACLLACLTGCGAADGGTRVEGPAPTRIPWTGSVYVLDWRSVTWQRPDLMDLTDSTVLDRMTWHDWGASRATATGWVIDLPCASGCPHGSLPGYAVTIVLSGLVKRQYAAYYSRAAVTPVHPPAPDWAEDVSAVSLHVPKA